ncbi:MAG TPA: protein kinase [Blastocatellia bacterium]|nr:protein kinase [Blastocatellia bacterium]
MIAEKISHYRILDKLGAGGMGEVYLAEDTRLGRQVALKFLPASYQYDPDRRARFLKEARAASALRSPNIAAIYDIGEHEDSLFIVMEYVEGELLSNKLRRGPTSVLEAIEIALQVADALDEAHSIGIIHRDIKSSNLIITERGLVKILDFGLAKVLTQQTEADDDSSDRTMLFGKETLPGVVLGTASYMSPEQARGLEVDQRSDTFSLGVVLYEMLTGKRPFEGATTSDLIVSILERDPPPLGRFSADVPANLEWIVAKALRKQRRERYQTAKDFGVDLKNLKQALEFEANLIRTTRLEQSSGSLASRSTGEVVRAEDSSSGLTSPATTSRRRTRKAIDSIAILPFSNVSNEPDTDYLSDGITESIINNLSQLPRLRVMARSTMYRYKGKPADPQQTGRDLGVRAVLAGRVLQRGETLLISTELVDVNDGSQLWGEQYSRHLADLFAVQEEISSVISDKLRLKLSGKEKKQLGKRHTENTEAYQLYLKGRYHWNKWTQEGFNKALEYYERAIELDPQFGLAYSGLSDAYGALWYFNYLPAQEALPKATATALKAIEIDERLAEAHLSLADAKFFYEWDWPTAEREYKRAIELNPSYANAHHMYAFFLMSMDKPDEAIEEIRRAQQLDPLSVIISGAMGMPYYYTRQYDRAIKEIQKSLELDPNFLLAREHLAVCYEMTGRHDEAVEEYLKAIVMWGSTPGIADALREAYRQGGMRAFWQKRLDMALERSSETYFPPYFMAELYANLDERDKAFEWLERAFEERAGFLVHIKSEPAFDNLRPDPRFADLLRRIGFVSS